MKGMMKNNSRFRINFLIIVFAHTFVACSEIKNVIHSDKDILLVNQNVSGLSIVHYNKSNHTEVLRNIVSQGADFLYDSRASSTEQKTSAIMDFLVKNKYTKILLNAHNCPIGFVNFSKENFNVGHIMLLGVDDKNQRKGYGTLLMRHAMDELKKENIKSIIVDVQGTNNKARTLYEKLGFVFNENVTIGESMMRGTYKIDEERSYEYESALSVLTCCLLCFN